MRDPKRIQPFLNRLALTWERTPDLRFGQLVNNIASGSRFNDFWFQEEPEWIEAMRKFDEEYLVEDK